MAQSPNTWFVGAGLGPGEEDIKAACLQHEVSDRLLTFGVLSSIDLRNLYRAFDVFVFASQSETQGIVLAEAMAAGVPVVAVDAPGVREIVRDRINGRLIDHEDPNEFVEAIRWITELNESNRAVMIKELESTANEYSIERATRSMLDLYRWANKVKKATDPDELHRWRTNVNRIEREWRLWSNVAHAICGAVVTAAGVRVI